jgi:hypothetical protein
MKVALRALLLLALALHADPASAQDETRPLGDLSVVKTEPVAPPRPVLRGGDASTPASFFADWSVSSDAAWTSVPGFEATPDGLRKSTLSPSWLALGPAWRFTVKASSRGPGGIRLTARAGGTSGQRLPESAAEVLDRGPARPEFATLDPAMRQTIWSAGLLAERTFRLRQLDLTLFGEALLLTGEPPGTKAPKNEKKPLRTTAGMRLEF